MNGTTGKDDWKLLLRLPAFLCFSTITEHNSRETHTHVWLHQAGDEWLICSFFIFFQWRFHGNQVGLFLVLR